jgi:flagellar M-ring protein FliF
MALKITSFKDIYEQIIKKLTFTQKIIIASVVLTAIIGIIIIIIIANKPTYNVLFSNLDPPDANKIIEKLNERGVKYELSDNGKTISIPKEQVYEMRLQLAGEGLPLSSVVGYEIFDKTNFGISDFQQKVNYKRALEGEMVRTILKLEAVEGAQVKIVVPEKALFKEDQKKATASVVLKLKSSRGISSENVVAITNLIASSVEGLDPSNVTVIDSKGHLLSNVEPSNKLASMTASQYDLKRKVEAYLSDKAQSMLDQVLGAGKSVVRVNAELNFNQTEKTTKSYDPNIIIRSQETNNQSEIVYDTNSETKRGTTLTNYEVGETVEHLISEVGAVKKLSIAVMVDGTYKDSERNGQYIREFIPRTLEEMTKITGVVKNAVGFDETRSDLLSIENIVFDTSLEGEIGLKKKYEFDMMDIIKYALVALSMFGAVFILRSLLKKLKLREPSIAKEEKLAKEIPIISEIREIPIVKPKVVKPPPVIEIPEAAPSEEELKSIELRKRVAEYMDEKPLEAVNLIKLWLIEEEAR